jgi:hypothetical protein
MADVPFPLTAETLEDLKAQMFELIRQVYEERIGGANLGDVFSIGGEVLQLEVNTDGGLEKSSNAMQMKVDSTGGLATGIGGAAILLADGSGLLTDGDGLTLTHTPGTELVGSKTWAPGSIADGTSAGTTVEVTGVAAGDPAICALAGITSGNWTLTAYGASVNTVQVIITNNTGGAVDPGSSTLSVVVWGV